MIRPRMVFSGATEERAPRALAVLLDAMTRWNLELMRENPGAFPPLYEAGVRYQREDYKGAHPEDWRDAPEVLRRGGGDCEDLACYRAAELRAQGEAARAMFHAADRADGGRLFHIIVRRGDGSLEDPSRALGM